ncbi:ArnT family glycosyltransferase [Shewanella sp. YIC-542]|uniref:ArnT family glycosyltransferase n=1 Tax=Shewanella mytili TaxID=3377111 RepID=UPI00398E5F5A
MNVNQPRINSLASLSPPLLLLFTLLMALLLIATHMWLRPLMPIDETRYVSVAWEMWRDNNWLVPHKNGETYAHKPPLLFWLINLFWGMFGTNELATRLAIPLFACGNFGLLYLLARQYYPREANAAGFAPLVLLALGGWSFYLPTTMFDSLLSIFVLLWCLSCVWLSRCGQKRFMLLGAIAIGGGLLAKGPVMLLYALPFMLLRPWWQHSQAIRHRRFFSLSLMAMLLGVGILACWLLPAIVSGGAAYENELLWKQTTGRVVSAFAHARPWYWYLYWLPVLLLPLPLMGGVWRSRIFQGNSHQDKALLLYIGIIVLCFSLISGKQLHYLCPLMPLIALFIAKKLQTAHFQRSYPLAIASLLVMVLLLTLPLWAAQIFKNLAQPQITLWAPLLPLLMLGLSLWRFRQQQLAVMAHFLVFPILLTSMLIAVRQPLHAAYDVSHTAQYLRQLQDKGHQLAFWNKYDNQFQFSGRLQTPLAVLNGDKPARLLWLQQHPQTIVIYPAKNPSSALRQQAMYEQPYRGRFLLLFEAPTLLALMTPPQETSVFANNRK